jgi:hypothetical protein
MTLMIVNLACSLAMTTCGLWILTGQHMSRLVRIFCALIATGGSVNALGMIAALCNLGNFVYGDIWPGEVIVNIGTSALMMRWTWRTLNSQRHVASPNPA